MNLKRNVVLAFLATFSFSNKNTFAQLNVSTGLTPTQYAQQLVGPGVTISNVTYAGSNGGSSNTGHAGTSLTDQGYQYNVPIYQIGSFTGGGGTNLGISDGLILSSGEVRDAGKPAQFFSNSYLNNFGVTPDADLKKISGNKDPYDKSVLEFDFIPTGPHIKFQYVFASEEYPNWVGQSYNDAFGFFLSGPGISGTYSNNAINIALIPNTSTPVSINNINNGSGDCQPMEAMFGGGMTGGNSPGTGPCQNCQYYVNNCGGQTICFGGFTTVMTAEADVQCGQTYHIKLAVSDIGDNNWDAAIFLIKNSLTSDTIGVTTNPPNSTVCAGNSIDITAQMQGSNTGGTYSWSTGQSGQTITVTPPSNQDYIVTYTVSGCSIKDTVHVIVDNCTGCTPPTLNILPVDVCSPNSADLATAIGTGSGNATKTYYPTQADANNATNAIGTSVATTGSYWVRAENPSDPTCFNIYEIHVTITTVTYTATITDATCGASDGEIALVGANGATPYSYSIDNGANYQSTSTFSNLAANSYQIIVKDNNGCEAKGTEAIANSGAPSITQTTSVNPTCADDCNGTITVVVTGGATPYTYAWYDSNNTVIGTNANSINNLCVGNYKIKITDNNNCDVTATSSLTAPNADNATFTLTNYCEGGSNTATNIVTSGGTFSFSPAVSDDATINATTGSITNGVGGTTYSVKYVTNGSCPDSTTQQVVVVKNPTADFTANPTAADISNPTINFTNNSQNATSYSWSFGDNSALDNATNASHTYPNTTAGTYTVTLTATNTLGCSATKTATIQIDSLVIVYSVPNIFTPNADGANEEFMFITNQNLKTVKTIILNRWGNVVFTSEDVNFKWNGKDHNSGQKCSDGTYFYKIEIEGLNNKKYVESGFVTLSR